MKKPSDVVLAEVNLAREKAALRVAKLEQARVGVPALASTTSRASQLSRQITEARRDLNTWMEITEFANALGTEANTNQKETGK